MALAVVPTALARLTVLAFGNGRWFFVVRVFVGFEICDQEDRRAYADQNKKFFHGILRTIAGCRGPELVARPRITRATTPLVRSISNVDA